MAFRKALLVLAGGVLVLAASACGGSSSSDEETPVETATPPAGSTEQPTAGPAGSATARATSPGDTPGATATPPPAGPEGAVPEVRPAPFSTSSGEAGDSGDDDPTRGEWVTPLSNWDRLGDPAGAPRGERLVHGGIDFDLTTRPDAPVYAACDGFVAGIDWSNTHGTFIVVKCPDQWTSVYAFLEEVLVGNGDPVVKGETVIARAGAFLHFETRYNFVPVDPAKVIDFGIRPKGVIIPTPTPTNTPTPTATPTPRPGDTPRAGETPGATVGPPPTPTSTPTVTPTPTATPIHSGNPSPTPTKTPLPTATPKPSPSPTATPRPPTATPTPLPQGI